MEKFLLWLAAAFVLASVLSRFYGDDYEHYTDPSSLAWCDSIYHRNIGCPKYGEVEVPAAVLAKEEADNLAWCGQINYRNVSCDPYK